MKKFLSTLFALTLSTCLLATSAFATDDDDHCSGDTCMPDDFSATVTESRSLDLNLGAAFGGVVEGVFEGDTGEIQLVEDGGSNAYLNMTASGDGCGIDCGNIHYDLQGEAYQTVGSWGSAESTTPGTPTSLSTVGIAQVAGTLDIEVSQSVELDTTDDDSND